MQVIGVPIGFPMPVPLLARAVRAGFPSPADDFIEEEIDLQRLLIVNRPATFLVRVAGDSMISARLFDGDVAIVDSSLTPRSGDIVVVDIDGERAFNLSHDTSIYFGISPIRDALNNVLIFAKSNF